MVVIQPSGTKMRQALPTFSTSHRRLDDIAHAHAKTKPMKNAYALMQDKTELLRGDFASISIIHRNLTGQNPVSTGYVEMMEKQLEMTIDASKLWIDKRISVPKSRVQRGDVATLHSLSGRYVYELDSDRQQFFCETPAAWELWDETEQLQRVRRWPKKRISWVILKD